MEESGRLRPSRIPEHPPRMASGRRRSTLIGLAVALSLVWSGCGAKKPFAARSSEEAFDYAMARYQDDDYPEAISGFQRVIFDYPGDELVDQAMYYLGNSYFLDEDYLSAANEFKRVSSEFPDGPYAMPALYKMGLCYARLSPSHQLDQTDTHRSINAFDTLIKRFPESAYADSARIQMTQLQDKLARKEYESGYYYFKREYYDSAIIYFEILREEYPGSRWMPPTLYFLAEAYEKLELDDDAVEARKDLLRLFPDSAEARKVKEEFPALEEEGRASAG